MFNSLNKYFLTFTILAFVFTCLISSYAHDLKQLDNLFIVTQQKTIINYEKSQPSSIDNPVVDPNFNVMRSSDTESSTATYIVIGLLIVATIIPLATWWYFSK